MATLPVFVHRDDEGWKGRGKRRRRKKKKTIHNAFFSLFPKRRGRSTMTVHPPPDTESKSSPLAHIDDDDVRALQVD